MSKHWKVLGAVVFASLPFLTLVPALAGGNEKVTICHAAGQEGTTHYITLTIGYNAVYGPAGHFYENGTPRAGHEQDYLGPCQGDSETPTPTPTETETPPPTPTETEPPTPTETDDPFEPWTPTWTPTDRHTVGETPRDSLAHTGGDLEWPGFLAGAAGIVGLAALYASRKLSLGN